LASADEGEPPAKRTGERTKKLRRTKSQGIDKNDSAVKTAQQRSKEKLLQNAGATAPTTGMVSTTSSTDLASTEKAVRFHNCLTVIGLEWFD